MRGQHARQRRRRERLRAREDLVQHHPHRVDVAARVELIALHLLGAHVVRRADDEARLGHPFLRLGHPRDAEVHQLHLALVVDEDVLRLDVAVDDPLLVRGLQPAANLA